MKIISYYLSMFVILIAPNVNAYTPEEMAQQLHENINDKEYSLNKRTCSAVAVISVIIAEEYRLGTDIDYVKTLLRWSLSTEQQDIVLGAIGLVDTIYLSGPTTAAEVQALGKSIKDSCMNNETP